MSPLNLSAVVTTSAPKPFNLSTTSCMPSGVLLGTGARVSELHFAAPVMHCSAMMSADLKELPKWPGKHTHLLRTILTVFIPLRAAIWTTSCQGQTYFTNQKPGCLALALTALGSDVLLFSPGPRCYWLHSAQ